jgi:hypothetical protein
MMCPDALTVKSPWLFATIGLLHVFSTNVVFSVRYSRKEGPRNG